MDNVIPTKEEVIFMNEKKIVDAIDAVSLNILFNDKQEVLVCYRKSLSLWTAFDKTALLSSIK